MGLEHWESRYRGLRADLESAYASDEWDTARIDEIANELALVEQRLSNAVLAPNGSA